MRKLVILLIILSFSVMGSAQTPGNTKIAKIPITISEVGTFGYYEFSEIGACQIINAIVNLGDVTGTSTTMTVSFADSMTTGTAGANIGVYRVISKTVSGTDIVENSNYQQIITEQNPVTLYQDRTSIPIKNSYIRWTFSNQQAIGTKGYLIIQYKKAGF